MERSVKVSDLKVGDVITWSQKGTTGRVIEARPTRDGDNGWYAVISPEAVAAAYTTIRVGGRTIRAENGQTVRILVEEEW